jgi:hypothetical protein
MAKVELSVEQLMTTIVHLRLHIKKTERDLADYCGGRVTRSDLSIISGQMDKLQIICALLENAAIKQEESK